MQSLISAQRAKHVYIAQTKVQNQACLYLQNTSWQGFRGCYEITSSAQQIIIIITAT